MNSIATKEYIVIGLLVGLLFASMMPALMYMRREKRDGIRRDEVAAMKQVLEGINNETGIYPVDYDASPHEYVVTKQVKNAAQEWHLRAQLENSHDEMSGFDEEAGRNYYYRIVRDGDTVFYDVCGGEATCGAEKRGN